MSTSHESREDSAAAGAPGASGPPSAAPHPLDPLTAEEIRHVASVLRLDRAVGPRWLRAHFGSGGTGISTGAGPVTYYRPLRRRRGR